MNYINILLFKGDQLQDKSRAQKAAIVLPDPKTLSTDCSHGMQAEFSSFFQLICPGNCCPDCNIWIDTSKEVGMEPRKSLVQFGIVIALALIVELAFIAVEHRQTPARVAEAFARNYYYLDPAMGDQLCNALSADGNAVSDYLYNSARDTDQRGFSANYARRLFTEMHIQIRRDGDAAVAHITGETRAAINPVYMVIAKWFHFGEAAPVDMHLELVREAVGWRVCGGVPGLHL